VVWFGELAVLPERQELYPKAFKSFMEAFEEIPNVAIFYLKNQNFFPTLKVFRYYLQKPRSRSGILIHHAPASGFNEYVTESTYTVKCK
jgi:hypothetical protein